MLIKPMLQLSPSKLNGQLQNLRVLLWLPCYILLSLICIYWYKQPGSLLFSPFSNILLIAVMLRQAQKKTGHSAVLPLIVLALLSDVVVYRSLQVNWTSAVLLCICNSLQVLLSYHYCRTEHRALDENPIALLRFFLLACCLPAYYSGSLASIWFLLENQTLSKGLGWIFGNVLVNLLGISLLVSLQNRPRQERWPGYTPALLFLYLACSMICLVFLPNPIVYLNAALLLAAVFCPFQLGVALAILVFICLQIALPLGYFALPPMTSHWQLLLYAIPLFLMFLTPLLLNASTQQARNKVAAHRTSEQIASREKSEKSQLLGKLVTEQKAYHEAQEKLKALLEQISDAIIGIDAAGLVETFNPAAEHLYGVSASQITGKNFFTLFVKPGHTLELSEAHLQPSKQWRFDGSEFMADIIVCRYQTDQQHKTLLVIRDLSQHDKTRQFNAEFISTVSYELRTPLTSIRAALSFLANDLFDSNLSFDSRKMVKIALSNSERLGNLINDLLDMQKIEAGKMDFRYEVCVLEEFLPEVIQANGGLAEKYKVMLALQNTVPYSKLWVDKHRLAQVLHNLIANACKFSSEGQSVEIIVESESPSQLSLIVRDHGQGIDEKYLPQLFQRYSQFIHTESRAQGGTGLGLAIAYHLIKTMGGTLSYQATAGGGSSFVISFTNNELAGQAD